MTVTSQAQGVEVAIGLGKLALDGAAIWLAVNEMGQPILPPDHHAVVKHGAADANSAYRETLDTSKSQVTQYHCSDGRDRSVNWITGAIRVEQGGQPITAFHANRDDLGRVLLRDGCIEELPTRAIGHDDLRQIPPRYYSAATSAAGPVKSGTPTAMQVMMAKRKASGGGSTGGK